MYNYIKVIHLTTNLPNFFLFFKLNDNNIDTLTAVFSEGIKIKFNVTGYTSLTEKAFEGDDLTSAQKLALLTQTTTTSSPFTELTLNNLQNKKIIGIVLPDEEITITIKDKDGKELLRYTANPSTLK